VTLSDLRNILGDEASRGLSATAELLVTHRFRASLGLFPRNCRVKFHVKKLHREP